MGVTVCEGAQSDAPRTQWRVPPSAEQHHTQHLRQLHIHIRYITVDNR